MPRFGFSAFLKLICLNPRPRRTEILTRRRPSDSGYDFHRSLRLAAGRLIRGEIAIADALLLSALIVKQAERESCISGLTQINEWINRHRYPIFEVNTALYESPNSVFSILYAPDFGVVVNRQRVAVHIWNTIRPDLEDRFVYASLYLMAEIYAGQPDAPDDVALLSLRTGTFYRLSDYPDQVLLAERLVAMVEKIFKEVDEELRFPTRDGEAPAPFPPAE